MDKKSNVVFNDWTPHNVRRLIIGMDKAIIQYHVTGAKYPNLVQVVDYSAACQEDLITLRNNPTQLKSLVGVLVDKRICSAVEEIAFCIANYDRGLFAVDYDMSKLVPSNGNIENRFPRLAKVFLINASVDAIEQYVRNAKNPMTLLLTELNHSGVPCQVKQDCNKQWYYGNTKFWNSTIYIMDSEEGALYKRLASVADEFRNNEKAMKLKETVDNRDAQIVANVSNYLKITSDYITDIETKERDVLSKLSYVDKVRFGMYVMPSVVAKTFKNVVGNNAEVQKIYWLELKVLFEKYEPALLPLLYKVYCAVQGKTFKESEGCNIADQYKKDELFKTSENVKKYYQLARKYFIHVTNMSLVSLLACLSPVGLDFAGTNYNTWQLSGAENIAYSVETSEDLNIVLSSKDRLCGKALSDIGCNLMSEDNLKNPNTRYNNAMTSLDLLMQYKENVKL